ncbi:hemolytic protein HlpA [Rhabdobacter roseus]|uniref:Nucleotide-diphospho-sugar transferase n=1 Tax=Rhabdobacter roseus TaxID=1655419 RepID=A0A840TIS6_9BACT|nr:hypothetical protein [Rhabdobacter roseus]MBB5283261.1 hypothetical protein [Rhabdobacter roseus]
MFETPVLLIIFNRPHTAQRTLDEIRKVKPKQLFIAADGPRPDRPDDVQNCADTRAVINQIDWPCEVKTYFRQENRGCGYGPAEAITWFFKHVEQGIILEDDCLPDPSFFGYCAEVLNTYKHDPRVAIVSGTNPVLIWRDKSRSYLFSVLPNTWGWATWRRAWDKFDYQASGWHTSEGKERVRKALNNDLYFYHFAREFDDYFVEVRQDVWDFQWYFCCLYHGSYGIIPARNLISNIGFDENATHTFNVRDSKANMPTFNLNLPLRHKSFGIDRFFDRYLFERTLNRRKRSFLKKATLKTIKILQSSRLL